ncbi:hypothetical protein ABBQ32_004468 [Trebouxia sp. C0010 RCD-2024]
MQTASMLRTAAPSSSSRVCCNRTVFQTKPVPAIRRNRATLIRAEADNTGGSITNSGQTKGKDSYEKIEAPVRNDDSADRSYAYGGKPIGERQNDVDRLLVDRDEPEEKRFLGTEVAFPDALRFKGAAPEIANSRLAMLGVVSALALEFGTGKNVFQQVQSYPGTIAFVSLLFIVATMVPILRGYPRKGNFIFTSGRELINGRIAMLGFVALLATEYFSGGQTIPHFYGLLK